MPETFYFFSRIWNAILNVDHLCDYHVIEPKRRFNFILLLEIFVSVPAFHFNAYEQKN